MTTRVRVWLLGCAALLLVIAPFATPVRAGQPAEQPGGSPTAQLTTAAPAPALAGAPLRQAYDLILDNFVTPPAPAALLGATAAEVARHAAETVPGEWPTPTIPPDAPRDEAWAVFAGWLDRLLPLVTPAIERPAAEELVMRALAAAVGEQHTRYLNPRQHEEHQAWRRGDLRYEGVGLRLRRPSTVVLEVFEGSPAARAGLRTGDRIVAVDGEPTAEAGSDGAIGRIRGPLGTPVELLVERRGQAAPLRLVIERAEVRIPFVTSAVLVREDGRRYGYLRVRGFPEMGVDEGVGRALAELERAGIDGLVLDLRGNSGGRIDVGIKVISRFVRQGPIFQQADRAGRQRVVEVSGGYWERSVPVVALVDGGTASMGEILASALQESGAARLVGARTSGSVAGARLFPLANGGALQITVLTIVSGKGAVLNDVGISPDAPVELTDDDLLDGEDAQLEAALRQLRSAAGQARPLQLLEWLVPGEAA